MSIMEYKIINIIFNLIFIYTKKDIDMFFTNKRVYTK